MRTHGPVGELELARKVLGILGSPCVDGNASLLLDAVLDGARDAGAEVERLNVSDLRISPCDGCGRCDSEAMCSRFKDDMTPIYAKLRQVDALVLSSPIYFMTVSAQLKVLIDRCQCFWTEKYISGKRAYEGRKRPKGLYVACAGSSKASVFEPSLHTVRALFQALDYEYAGEILLGGTDSPDIETLRKGALEKAYDAGRALVR